MKTSYYKRLSDTKLAVVDLLPSSEFYSEAWVIARVNVPKPYRRQGIGTLLMAEVLSDADTEGVKLALEINPYDGSTWDQLAIWYKSFGFEFTQYGYMVRTPTSRRSAT